MIAEIAGIILAGTAWVFYWTIIDAPLTERELMSDYVKHWPAK